MISSNEADIDRTERRRPKPAHRRSGRVAASRRPDAPALVVTSDRMPVSYRDLVRLVDDLAGQLKRAGLLPGDRVALRAGSNAEFVVGLLAASRAELIVVPLDPALPISEQRTRSEVVGARAVLVDGDNVAALRPMRLSGSRPCGGGRSR